ncbi:SDR family oxidoreductase [Herbaspirillum lusitanum]|uniref:SDR family oxidoreductase n=1 Tax=Herbaspirillum lusitanum TaxID=213312 RepID=UPI0022388513|nr:NmrA family NAD(P)-binding protein [Herbaspirillum lusitanum]
MMQEKIYLVYGATGAQGGAVMSALRASGKKVRVLLRNTDGKSSFEAPGVEVAIGDLDSPAQLLEASRDVAGVYFALPLQFNADRAILWGRNAIDAAVAAKAPLMVFNTSIVGAAEAGQTTGSVAIDIKSALERYLKQAPIPSIVLRPTLYLGNLTAPFATPSIVNDGVLAYPVPAGQKVSWISWEETAAYVVAALQRPDLAATRPSFDIGGAQAITGNELATAIGKAVGRSVSYFPLPIGQFEAGLSAAFGAETGGALANLYRYMTNPAHGDILNVDLRAARAEFAVPQTSIDSWAAQVPWKNLAESATAPSEKSA